MRKLQRAVLAKLYLAFFFHEYKIILNSIYIVYEEKPLSVTFYPLGGKGTAPCEAGLISSLT